jgi:large subunit ribosomal protein L15
MARTGRASGWVAGRVRVSARPRARGTRATRPAPAAARLPKRGFKNPFRTEYEIVNLRDFERVEGDEVTPEVLHAQRLVDLGKGRQVKVLGQGDVQRKLTVRAHAVSASARAKIEAAGGSVELLEG